MKKIISMLLAFVMCFSCMAVLSSCGAPKDAGPEISVYLGEEIYDFDPTDYYTSANQEAVMSLLFDPLFRLDDDGDLLKEGAAKKYSVDKDKRTIVIELRETYWSDEVRVKAYDYVYAWRNVLLDPNHSHPAAALLYDIENAAEIKKGDKSIYDFGAVNTDDYELTITYREGADVDRLLKNLASVATAPLRPDIYSATVSGYWTKVLNYSITNGPFRIEEVNYEEGSFTVARNVGYHQPTTARDYTAQVNPAKLISLFNVSGSEMKMSYADLTERTVFYLGDASLKDRLEHKNEAKVVDTLSTYTYMFNTDNELFKIKEVRQALLMAIDREAIANAIVFAKAATGFLPETVIDCANGKSIRRDNEIISKNANLEDARALLAKVNYGSASKAFTLTVDNSEESVAIANLVKTAWDSLGFTVTIKAVGDKSVDITDFKTGDKITIKDSELQTIVKEASRGNRAFDVIGLDWHMYSKDSFVALSAFSTNYSGCGRDLSGAGTNLGSFGGWVSEAYDKNIADAYAAKNDNKTRSEQLRAAEKLLIDEAVVCPIVFNQNFAFMDRDVRKVNFDGFGNAIFTETEQRNYNKK